MKGKIKIGKRVAYIPEELRNEGFTGKVEFLASPSVVALIKPGATEDEVEKSLQIILQAVQLRRIESERREKEIEKNRATLFNYLKEE